METAGTVPRYLKLLLFGVFLVGFVLPPFAYWLFIGRARSVTPEDARRDVLARRSGTVLVDIRPRDAYAEEHVAAAENWPRDDIEKVRSARDVPARFRNKRLLLICENGILSASASLKLASLKAADAYAVRDGICGWVAAGVRGPASGDSPCRLIRPTSHRTDHTQRPSPILEQYAAVLSGFVIKPLYMALAFVLIVWLWRRAASPDLAALRWSMVAFLSGEASCAVNYLLLNHQSHLAEYLHSSGMVASFALAGCAMVRAADLRLVHFSDRKHPCAFAQLCGPCGKHVDAPCGMRRLLILFAAGLMVMALLPLCHQPETVCYNTAIFGRSYTYAHPVIYQLFETRFCPVYALVFLGASLLAMVARKRIGTQGATVLLAAGIGTLGFGMLRLFLFAAFRDHLVWSVFWEEASELLVILTAAALLWIFRKRLFEHANAPSGPP